MSKVLMLLNMAFNPNVVKGLWKTYKILNQDKSFGARKFIKMQLAMLKGEKIVKFEDRYIISTFMPPFPSKSFFTNLFAVDDNVDIFTKQIYAKRTAPISMYLCLTHKCNNNCLYCSSRNRENNEELSTTEWIDVIKQLQDMKVSIIGLTGGEPLIREDIFEIVESIDDRSTSILFTSGVNLCLDQAKELKRRGLFGIGISLDSFDKNEHNKNRKDDKAFDLALQALRNSREAGLYTMAQTVILKDNLKEESLFKLFKLAKENGAHEVKILEPILSGNLFNDKNLKGIFYDKESRKKLIEIQHKANRMKGFPKVTSFAYTESEEKFGCGAGNQHSYISATGDLYPCDFLPMNFGNVRNQKIQKLWLEMKESIGDPKIGCYAQKVNMRVYKEARGKLPLQTGKSKEICNQNKSDIFPKYYRELQ